MRCAVIFNPTARGGQARRLFRALEGIGENVALTPTTGPGTAPALAAEAAQSGCDVIVAAGGDGTVSEVVDGLASEPGLLDQARLGIIPLGTINVFARELGLPLGMAAAWEIIQSGHERRVDLPRVAFDDGESEIRRSFMQLAGAGLDSRAISLVSWNAKRRIGWLAYLIAGLRALRGPHPLIRVEAGERSAAGQLVVIGNGQRYGGEIQMFPGARLDDGQLDVRVFQRVGIGTLFRFARAWLSHGPLPPSADICFRAAEFSLVCDAPMPFQLDGDNAGSLSAKFTVRPRALRVCAPG